MEADANVGAIVATGSAFAAGADIKEMKDRTFIDVFSDFITKGWNGWRNAASRPSRRLGLLLGGGCEEPTTRDMIIAAETAKFGQPDNPRCGGTSAWRAPWARPRRWTWCSRGA